MADQVSTLGSVVHQSGARIADAAQRWVPGFVALVVVLLIAFVFAALVRLVLRWGLRRIGFDQRAHEWGVAAEGEWPTGHPPSAVLSSIGFWLVMLLGLVVGLQSFDGRLMEGFATRILDYVPHIAASVLILILGFGVSRFVERSVLIRAVNLQIQSARLLSLGAKWLIVILAAAMTLNHLGIGGAIVTIAFSILFGGIVLALALAVGLGSQHAVGRALERRLDRERRPSEEQKIRHF
jgi:hypothetical protein